MSQRLIFELLQELDNGITRSELTQKIEEKHPERSLSQYAGHRLSTLVEKGAVVEDTRNGETVYRANPDFSSDDLSVSFVDFNSDVDREDLQSHGIEVTNIVGNGTFCERIDLQRLGADLPNVEYEPETSPMAVWRPFEENAATVLIPATGRITIVGSRNHEEIRETIDEIYAQLRPYAEDIVAYDTFLNNFKINNIAATGSLNRELELSAVAVGLGLGKTEYEPDQFPGIIYRSRSGVVTLIFRSGNVVITSNTYADILDGWENLRKELDSIGVDIESAT